MDVHATGFADRLAAPLFRQVLLIQSVAGFMQDAHQASGKICFVIAGGDAQIIRRATGKRMQANIKPALAEIKSELGHQLLTEDALLHFRKRALG